MSAEASGTGEHGVRPDWTVNENGRSNSSSEFLRLVAHVEVLIRNSAHDLISGRSDMAALLIMAQLAHIHGLAPTNGDTLVEGFRKALMVAHADDWTMETISEAAHICAAYFGGPS